MKISSGVTVRCWRHLHQLCSLRQCHLACRRPAAQLVAPPAPAAADSSRVVHPALCRPLHTTPTLSVHTTPAEPFRATEPAALHTSRHVSRQPRQADPDYEIIYRFPHILTARLICRLKIYQTGLTLAAVPVTAVLQDLGAAAKVRASWVIALLQADLLLIIVEFRTYLLLPLSLLCAVCCHVIFVIISVLYVHFYLP